MFTEVWDFFNNREKAIIIWISLFLLVGIWGDVLAFKSTGTSRKSFFKSIVQFLRHAIRSYRVLGITAIYIYAEVFVLARIGLWNYTLLKDVFYWVLGTAFGLLIGVTEKTKNQVYFKKVILGALTATFVLEFLANLFITPLLVEIVGQFVITAVVLLNVVAKINKDLEPLRGPTDYLLGAFGLIVFAAILIKVARDYDNILTSNGLRSLFIAPILTIGFLPYLYFLRIQIRSGDSKVK